MSIGLHVTGRVPRKAGALVGGVSWDAVNYCTTENCPEGLEDNFPNHLRGRGELCPRCGMQMLTADQYAAMHTAAEQQIQKKKLFRDIATGTPHLDR